MYCKIMLDFPEMYTMYENVIKDGHDVYWLVGFYGISTIGGYLMPNPFLYI